MTTKQLYFYILNHFHLFYSYKRAIENEKLTYIRHVISTIYGHDINYLNFFRKIKYLINKGLYNRFSKKYKSELLGLKIDEDKIDDLIQLSKENY